MSRWATGLPGAPTRRSTEYTSQLVVFADPDSEVLPGAVVTGEVEAAGVVVAGGVVTGGGSDDVEPDAPPEEAVTSVLAEADETPEPLAGLVDADVVAVVAVVDVELCELVVTAPAA